MDPIINAEATPEETRALLIEMRRFIISHDLLTGECVAWRKLKKLYGTGEDQAADDTWCHEYRTAHGSLDEKTLKRRPWPFEQPRHARPGHSEVNA